jgi:outer membrane protein assembly factor BamB
MPIRPRTIEIGRGNTIEGPVVTGDAIYAADKDDMTVRLDRQTLNDVWEVQSKGFWLGSSIGDGFLTVGAREGGIRSAAEGRLLWCAPTRFMGVGQWRGHAIIDSGAGMEIRDVRSGTILRLHEVPGGYEAWKLVYDDWAILETEHTVKAFDLSSGRLVWERGVFAEIRSRLPVTSDSRRALKMSRGTRPNLLVASYDGSTFGVSVTDGSLLWHARAWQPYGWPTAQGGRVYALCLNRFRAIDEETGVIVYDVEHPELKGAYRDKTGTFYKDRIAIANESGHLAVFRLSDGALISLYTAKVPLWRTAEADGRLLVGTGVGTLLVFDESIWGL